MEPTFLSDREWSKLAAYITKEPPPKDSVFETIATNPVSGESGIIRPTFRYVNADGTWHVTSSDGKDEGDCMGARLSRPASEILKEGDEEECPWCQKPFSDPSFDCLCKLHVRPKPKSDSFFNPDGKATVEDMAKELIFQDLALDEQKAKFPDSTHCETLVLYASDDLYKLIKGPDDLKRAVRAIKTFLRNREDPRDFKYCPPKI